MKIIYRDTDLTQHEIDLSKAVDVEINGLVITESKDGIIVSNRESHIELIPRSSNSLFIKNNKS